jgi:hypothetical protein
MSSFFEAIKADLLGVRLRLVVALLAIGLLASVAYVVLGGKSTKVAAPAASSALPVSQLSGIAVTQAPANPNLIVAETTSGTAHQHSGPTRDPFKPLPGTGATGSSGSTGGKGPSGSSTASSSAPSSSSGSSTSGGASPTTPAVTPKAHQPTKVKTTVHYHVTAQFGVIPAPTPTEPAKPAALKTFTDMPLDEPLPDKSNPQLVFLGVVLHTGKDAVFALAGEAILHGSAACLPSPTQCQAIQLQVGQTETLEAIEPDGAPVTYELKLVSILKTVSSASTASAHVSPHAATAMRRAVKAGREELRRKGGVVALSGLHYSHTPGVLMLTGRPASVAARARAAARHPHHGR